MKYSAKLLISSTIFIVLLAGCSDSGTSPQTSDPPPPTSPPQITTLTPDSAETGDVIRIIGTNFGAARGTSSVTIGGQTVTVFASWSDAEIQAEIPLLASTDSVRVTVGGRTSSGKLFRARQVSYAFSVQSLFSGQCTGCHGSSGGLSLASRTALLAGTSNNGPVVAVGDGEGSTLVKKLRGTAGFGSRMPQGGPFLSDAAINKISTWIQQGAKDN